jgi:3',5'-cyclic AMP phosphodiesterase CpdA
VTRRFAPTALGAVVVVSLLAWGVVWPFVTKTEDLLPGRAPRGPVAAGAWPEGPDVVRFAVVGDHGSGGRNAMRVASRMVETHRRQPFGLIVHAGDLVYYGDLDSRYDEVVRRPFGPLLDAGVELRPVLGNHDFDYAATLRALERHGLPGRYYSFRSGPVEFFMLDSTPPALGGAGGAAQKLWLEERLASSTATWRVAVLHHPLYSSGRHGSDLVLREAVEELFVRHGVDLVISGHDHHYERSLPQQGVTYIVTGGGAKLSRAGRSTFTAVSESKLHFLLVDADVNRLRVQAIDSGGTVFDEAVLGDRR